MRCWPLLSAHCQIHGGCCTRVTAFTNFLVYEICCWTRLSIGCAHKAEYCVLPAMYWVRKLFGVRGVRQEYYDDRPGSMFDCCLGMAYVLLSVHFLSFMRRLKMLTRAPDRSYAWWHGWHVLCVARSAWGKAMTGDEYILLLVLFIAGLIMGCRVGT